MEPGHVPPRRAERQIRRQLPGGGNSLALASLRPRDHRSPATGPRTRLPVEWCGQHDHLTPPNHDDRRSPDTCWWPAIGLGMWAPRNSSDERRNRSPEQRGRQGEARWALLPVNGEVETTAGEFVDGQVNRAASGSEIHPDRPSAESRQRIGRSVGLVGRCCRMRSAVSSPLPIGRYRSMSARTTSATSSGWPVP